MEEWLFSIVGRVQGVGYRASVIHFVNDNAMKIKGYVRNMPDDSVEVRAQGTPVELECLHDFLRHGPRMARVDQVLISKSRAFSSFEGFGVEY